MYRGQGLSVLNNTPLVFGPLAPERSNAWHLTAAGKGKTAFGPSLCQWVLMSALTYNGEGKVMGHHNKKERNNGGSGEDWWRGFYVQNLALGEGGIHKPRIF